MTQIAACHLRPHVLRRPPRRPPVAAHVRAGRCVRPIAAWRLVLASALALEPGA